MKKFAGSRPLAEIIANARFQNVAVDDYNYRVKGYDHICFGVQGGEREDGTPLVRADTGPSGIGFVMFNTFNGQFWGTTPEGVKFHSSEALHEHEPWFQALLSFFYVEKSA